MECGMTVGSWSLKDIFGKCTLARKEDSFCVKKKLRFNENFATLKLYLEIHTYVLVSFLIGYR